MSINKKNNTDLLDDQDDNQCIIITDHLVIIDVDTRVVLVNQQGSIKNIRDDNNGF